MDIIDHTETDSDNEGEEFYFESDYLALRGNHDYTAIIRTLAILECQRIEATKAIDKLEVAKKEALQDPEEFVNKLISGKLNLPGPIQIAELPKIDFEKYNASFLDNSESKEKESSKFSDTTVRGRVFDETKPQTFNQLWTCEEQRRLEELLIEYPPEPIEMRRFAKIARALGNRTTKQVASRVQKFFKKLHSAGMPVPGRIPKSRCRGIQSAKLYRPTTFFPAHNVPVQMSEDENFLCKNSIVAENLFQQKTSSSATSVSSFDKDTEQIDIIVVEEESEDDDGTGQIDDNLRILKLLQRVKRDKERDNSDRPQSEHTSYECNLCKEEPIVGTRWHCRTCIQESVDFCSDCIVSQILSENRHPISHKFVGLRISVRTQDTNLFPFDNEDGSDNDEETEDVKMKEDSSNFYDKDYLPLKFSKGENFNYLDPNFLPQA